MEIHFNGQITQAIYLQAQALHRNAPKIERMIGLGFLVLSLVAVVIGFVWGLETFLLFLPILIAPIALFILGRWVPRWQAISYWRTYKPLQDPISGVANAQGVNLNGTHFRGDFPWNIYTEYKQSPDMVLLYETPDLPHIFPKAFFEQESDWEAFVELVKRKVPQKPA
jgi:hypothetical protein